MKKIIFFNLIALSAGNLFAQITSDITLSQSFQQSVSIYNQTAHSDVTGNTGSRMTAFVRNEATQGSPYLIANWATGKVLMTDGKMYNQPDNSLNFDKEKQELILKLSNNQVFEINSKTVKSFELTDSGNTLKFVYLNEKPSICFMQLYLDSNTALYKTVYTKFYKADYVNRGLTESGYKYDRYVDEITYYVKPAKGGPIELKNVSKKKLKSLENQIPGIETAANTSTVSADDKEAFLIDVLGRIKK